MLFTLDTLDESLADFKVGLLVDHLANGLQNYDCQILQKLIDQLLVVVDEVVKDLERSIEIPDLNCAFEHVFNRLYHDLVLGPVKGLIQLLHVVEPFVDSQQHLGLDLRIEEIQLRLLNKQILKTARFWFALKCCCFCKGYARS